MTRLTWLALGLLLAAPAAGEEAPDDRRTKQKIQDELGEELRSVNGRCGASIQVSLDWRSFTDKGVFDSHSVSGYCAPPLSVLGDLCDAEDAREAIQRKVRRVVCHYGGSDGKRRSLRLRGGTLDWTLDLLAGNNDAFVREALRRSL